MKKKIFFVLACLPLLSPLVTSAEETEPYVRVSGQGEIRQKPDRVVMNFGIQTAGPTLKQAQDENSRRTEELLHALKKNGIADKDIQTTMAQINPRYDYVNGKQRFAEYTAYKNFSVEMDDVERYGKVLQAALDAGVTQTSGVQFDTSHRKELEDEALKLAVQDAEKKASALAKAAGRKRGDAITIEAASPQDMPMPMARARMAAMNAAPDDQVAPGEIVLHAGVTIKYKLQ